MRLQFCLLFIVNTFGDKQIEPFRSVLSATNKPHSPISTSDVFLARGPDVVWELFLMWTSQINKKVQLFDFTIYQQLFFSCPIRTEELKIKLRQQTHSSVLSLFELCFWSPPAPEEEICSLAVKFSSLFAFSVVF